MSSFSQVKVGVVGRRPTALNEMATASGVSLVSVAVEDVYTAPQSLEDLNALLILTPVLGRPYINRFMLEHLARFASRGGGVYGEGFRTDRLTDDMSAEIGGLFGFCTSNLMTVADLERIVVTEERHPVTSGFGPGTILEEHQPLVVRGELAGEARTLLRFERVLGTYEVVDQPDETVSFPALVTPRGRAHVLYATFSLMDFLDGAYAPRRKWWNLGLALIAWLCGLPTGVWATAGRSVCQRLPRSRWERRENSLYPAAVYANIKWFERSGLLPAPDGSHGVWEAVQGDTGLIRLAQRPDCAFETALAFYLHGRLNGDAGALVVAANMLKYQLEAGFRFVDTGAATYGFWTWYGPIAPGQRRSIYLDDNSWVGLVALHLGQLGPRRDDVGNPTAQRIAALAAPQVGGPVAQRTHRPAVERVAGLDLRPETTLPSWMRVELLRAGLRIANGLLQIQSVEGLVPTVISDEELVRRGRGAYRRTVGNNRFTDGSPHFGGMAAALLFSAYGLTADARYRHGAEQIMRYLREGEPGGFAGRYRVSSTEAYCRSLLPAALAVQYAEAGSQEQEANRAFLEAVHQYLCDHQDAQTGAVQEWGNPLRGQFRGDTAVFYEDGEPIADLLYTTNFALLNWYVAYRATGDQRFWMRFAAVASFLTRIQIRSGDPKVDGGWMRGYDYRADEWYGSNQDLGWGPYVLESGWTNAPISVALALAALDEPFQPMRQDERAAAVNEEVKEELAGLERS